MLIATFRAAALAPALVTVACASTPGARPHDMSVARHEAEAARHAGEARSHESRYRPSARAAYQASCLAGVGAGRIGVAYSDTCWSSFVNPTEGHLRQAAEHRRHAADHRAASVALREAEARACAGLPPDDRDLTPFLHAEDIESVTPLRVEETGAGEEIPRERLAGATVVFRAVEGLNAEWFQRLVDCHLARNAALGHEVPEMPDCPLVPKGARAQVRPVGNGFAVEITAGDRATANEILARARRLGPGSVEPTAKRVQ